MFSTAYDGRRRDLLLLEFDRHGWSCAADFHWSKGRGVSQDISGGIDGVTGIAEVIRG